MQGQADAPLSERGEEEARAIAPLLANQGIERVVCSDLSRAARTCELAGFPDAPRDARWREADVGDWADQQIADLVDRGEPVREWRAGQGTPPGGESWDAIGERVVAAIDDLVGADGGTVLAVAHGGPIRVAVWQLCEVGLDRLARPGNCSRTVLERVRGRWRIVSYAIP